MIYSRVIGTGGFLPEKVLTNADLEKIVDTTDEWIVSRTGIRQRHIAGEDETTSQLAERAARDAIAKAGIEAASIDLIVVATTTADHIFPSTATIVQERLGIISGCPAFDLQAVCTGFIYAIGVADKFFRTGTATRALVIGAETFSRILDWTDRQTCVLFGDGAGAVLLEAADAPGIVSTHLHADGRYREMLHVPAGVSTNYQEVLRGEAYLEMQGSEVFKFAVNTLGRTLEEILAANDLKDRKSTRLNSSHTDISRMPSSA